MRGALLAGDLDDQLALALAQRGLDGVGEAAAVGLALIVTRSTTSSIVCFFCFSSASTSSSRTIMPSMRTRTKPALRSSSNSSRNSPLRFSTFGASSVTCVLSGSGGQLVDDLAGGARADRAAALVAALLAGARVEHAQVVVDLGDRADGRARVASTRSSARSRWSATGRGCARTSASPSGRGTGARRPTATRRSGAGPRRRACRTRGSTCPSPTGPVNTTSWCLGISRWSTMEVVLARSLDDDRVRLARRSP